LLLTVILWFADRRRIPPGHCQKCGYDLTGNVSGICPECGTPVEREGSPA
jgi:predicted amidophosphoribosyltransferase